MTKVYDELEFPLRYGWGFAQDLEITYNYLYFDEVLYVESISFTSCFADK